MITIEKLKLVKFKEEVSKFVNEPWMYTFCDVTQDGRGVRGRGVLARDPSDFIFPSKTPEREILARNFDAFKKIP